MADPGGVLPGRTRHLHQVSIANADTEAEAGPDETAEIIAKVADSLMAVGALPVTSTLLREFPGSGPGWHTPLAHRWGRRARRRTAGFRAAEHRGLAVRLPLQHATSVIESVSAQGELVEHPAVWPPVGDGGILAHDHALLPGAGHR